MVTTLGGAIIKAQTFVSSLLSLMFHAIVQSFVPPFRVQDVFRQIQFVAWESAPIIIFSLSFSAIVTIIEASFHMKLVIQNDALVPGFSALLIIRELGAAVTALLITSRVGAGIAAEVGLMKVTEQLDALKMLGIDTLKFIVVPRFIACVVAGILLTLIADMVCLYAAMIVSQIKLGYTQGAFVVAMRSFVGMQDLLFSVIKGTCFAAVIPLVSCFYGFRCQAGAEGVGQATTNSVVTSSVLIIILDFVLSWIFTNFY
jgi:phospholipid/cholesterol/gamma-HCH transport system permease protein